MSHSISASRGAGTTRPRAAPGWVFYDADCRFCSGLAARMARHLERRGFRLEPLRSSNGGHGGFELWSAEGPDELRVLTPDGELLGGAEALLYLARWFWWARPLALAGRVPWVRAALRRGYAWVAAHRHCLAGGCSSYEGR